MQTFLKYSYLLFILVTSLCCSNVPGRKEYIEIGRSAALSESEQMHRFAKLSVNEQIDAYLFSQIHVEGASESFVRFMASDGESKIPQILARIDRNDDQRTKTHLIRVLDTIDSNCRCLGRNPDAIGLLIKNESRVMGDDSEGIRGFKGLYSNFLQSIRDRPKP